MVNDDNFNNYCKYIKHAITEARILIDRDCLRIIKECKDLSVLNKSDLDALKNISSKKDKMLRLLYLNPKAVVPIIEQYIPTMTYRYCYLFKYTHTNLENEINKLKKDCNGRICDHISKIPNYPIVTFNDSDKCEISFFTKITMLNSGTPSIYPISCVIYKKMGIFAIKYHEIHKKYAHNGDIRLAQVNFINRISQFMTDQHSFVFTEFPVMPIIHKSSRLSLTKKLNDEDTNIHEFKRTCDTKNGGSLNIQMGDNNWLPFITDLIELRKNMACEEDRNKLKDYIMSLEKGNKFSKRGLEVEFENDSIDEKGIFVCCRTELPNCTFEFLHFYSDIEQTREVVDCAIEFLYENNKPSKTSKLTKCR